MVESGHAASLEMSMCRVRPVHPEMAMHINLDAACLASPGTRPAHRCKKKHTGIRTARTPLSSGIIVHKPEIEADIETGKIDVPEKVLTEFEGIFSGADF